MYSKTHDENFALAHHAPEAAAFCRRLLPALAVLWHDNKIAAAGSATFLLQNMGRITLKHIAAEAGVSHVTVSLALRNRQKIPKSTRDRIQAIAQRLGYVPDPALGRLNAYRTQTFKGSEGATIAWINFWRKPERLRALSFEREYWRGGMERATELGFRLEEFCLHAPGMTPRRLCQILKARGIEGVIIPPAEDGMEVSIPLPWERLAGVRIGYSIPNLPIHLVANTQFDTAYHAVVRAVGLGARKIGYFFHTAGERKTRHHFMGGYLAALRHAGLPDSIPPLIPEGSEEETHGRVFIAWLEHHRPDCILTQYAGVMPWLLDHGVSVPSKVKVINLNLPATGPLRFSGMRQNSHQIGYQAVELLARLLRNGEFGMPTVPHEILVPGKWVDGETA